MTTLLKKAFEKAGALPEDIQRELAEQLLADIEGELKWDKTLASPKSQKWLKMMAAKVREE